MKDRTIAEYDMAFKDIIIGVRYHSGGAMVTSIFIIPQQPYETTTMRVFT